MSTNCRFVAIDASAGGLVKGDTNRDSDDFAWDASPR